MESTVPVEGICSLCQKTVGIKIADDGSILAKRHFFDINGSMVECDGSGLNPEIVFDQHKNVFDGLRIRKSKDE